jgi:acyl-CoA thioester hydrolase
MDTAGKKVFKLSIRIPYAHTDQMGFIYYANYLVYFEMARSEFLREVGLPYTDMEKRGIMLPVVVAHCEYKKPAHFDDLIEVRSCCTEFRGTRLHIEYEIWRSDDLIATGFTEHVCVGKDGKVLRPVPELRKLVETAR